MHAAELTHAVQRLRHAPWQSPVTCEAIQWLAESPSKAAIIDALACAKTAPVALEVACAAEIESEPIFLAVRQAIERNASLCWALVESLNRLPWYGGIRAFLSLEEPPESSPCVYPFYILARNKLFIPTNMASELYAYHYRGLWRLLPVAKSENWGSPHHSVLAVVEMMNKHLRRPCPDSFVVYFACLLLGRIAPLKANLDTLKDRAYGDGECAVRIAARLARRHLRLLHPGSNPNSACPRLSLPIR